MKLQTPTAKQTKPYQNDVEGRLCFEFFSILTQSEMTHMASGMQSHSGMNEKTICLILMLRVKL